MVEISSYKVTKIKDRLLRAGRKLKEASSFLVLTGLSS